MWGTLCTWMRCQHHLGTAGDENVLACDHCDLWEQVKSISILYFYYIAFLSMWTEKKQLTGWISASPFTMHNFIYTYSQQQQHCVAAVSHWPPWAARFITKTHLVFRIFSPISWAMCGGILQMSELIFFFKNGLKPMWFWMTSHNPNIFFPHSVFYRWNLMPVNFSFFVSVQNMYECL